MASVYILRSEKDGKAYVGSTRLEPDARLKIHNRGCVRSTKSRRPFRLIYSENFASYADAKIRELFFKTTSGRRTLKTILQ